MIREASDVDNKTMDILKVYSLSKIPVDIVELAHKNSFVLLEMLLPADITGMLLVDDNDNILSTNSNRVIIVSSALSFVQQRFVIAHELSHFFIEYDVNCSNQLLYRDRRRSHLKEEMDVDEFALSLLMPYDKMKQLLLGKKMLMNNSDETRRRYIMNYFWVSDKKANQRLIDLLSDS